MKASSTPGRRKMEYWKIGIIEFGQLVIGMGRIGKSKKVSDFPVPFCSHSDILLLIIET
jgi:hypothetical protein